jgi:hypothetical protein
MAQVVNVEVPQPGTSNALAIPLAAYLHYPSFLLRYPVQQVTPYFSRFRTLEPTAFCNGAWPQKSGLLIYRPYWAICRTGAIPSFNKLVSAAVIPPLNKTLLSTVDVAPKVCTIIDSENGIDIRTFDMEVWRRVLVSIDVNLKCSDTSN